jgi:hypothetical protein
MITLLGSLLGFFTSALPEFIKIYRDHKDRDHELAIMDRQIECMQKGHTQRLEEIQIASDAQVSQAMYTHARETGVRWVDALGGTVRPMITYAFFLLYASVKIAQILIIHKTIGVQSWADALVYIWHLEDQALFATVLSFWFGQRMLLKSRPVWAK